MGHATILSARARFNEKRRPAPSGHWPYEARQHLIRRVVYEGSPYHKRNPGDFRLSPPSLPRDDKTLCDLAGVLKKVHAQTLLRDGIKNGLVGRETTNGLPKYIWSIERDIVYEAQLTNSVQATYHGYPLAENDPVREIVLKWRDGDA